MNGERSSSAKAKQQKRIRFYSLYGLISHPETLRAAWQQVRANAGAPGVDGVNCERIEAQGEEQWLENLGQELRNQTYRCQWVRRVYIPKANGKLSTPGNPDHTGPSGSMRDVADIGANF